MVKGLEKFKEHFSPFNHQYVIIGGTACALLMEEAGLDFRATKDMDIVICVEALDKIFVKAFWEFIHKAGYQYRQRSTGKKLFYRFHAPVDKTYPEMLELFSRKPEVMNLKSQSHLTPITIGDEIASLSAILLDDDYYKFINDGKREIKGLSIASPEYLIPIKAKAWIDLTARINDGIQIDEKDIKKHRNDVLRLYALLVVKNKITVPLTIKNDMRIFLEGMKKDSHIELKNFGYKNTSLSEMINNLNQVYDL